MRLGMFMMPLHPAQRAPSQTLQEDREAERFDTNKYRLE